MTRNMFVVIVGFVTIALLASGGVSQQPKQTDTRTRETELRLLRAENNLLRAHIISLKKQLAQKESTVKKADAATQPVIAKKDSKTKTFTISENNPEWWINPKTLLEEVAIRTAIRNLYPEDSPKAWLNRQGLLIGNEISWEACRPSVFQLTEATAGKRYYDLAIRVESTRERLADQGTPNTNREFLLASDEGQAAWLKMVMNRKGSTALQAIYGNGPQITAQILLSKEYAAVLKKHDRAIKRGKRKVQISGTIVAVRLPNDSNVGIMLFLDGKVKVGEQPTIFD